MSETANEFLARLDGVEVRLKELAVVDPPPEGLTQPDLSSGERWDWGQVWAHLAEFVPYWVGEVRGILTAGGGARPAFGRTKTDPERVAAIERDRGADPRELMARVAGHVAQVRQLTRALGDDDWAIVATHPTLGEMSMTEIFEEFLVGHLEQHADQLEDLRAGA
jgi:DinB superfamily